MSLHQPARSTIARATRRTNARKLLRGQFQPRRVSLRQPVNVGLMAERAAAKFGRDVPIYLDQPFAWDPQHRVELDYVEYARLVEQMSAALAAAGVQKRDQVAIVKSPNYDVQAIAWAAARIGAIPAPLAPGLQPDVLNVLLDRLQPRVVITDPATAAHVGLDGARLEALSCTGIAVDGVVEGATPLADLWGAPVPPPNPVRDDEPMMITHTSSTTGVSKLVEASATGVTFSALMESIFPFAHSHDELYANTISHVHVAAAAQQLAAFSRGTPVLGIGQPTDETILRLFSRYRPTIVEAHPNDFMRWEQLATDPAEPFSSVRLFFNTFDAIHPRTIRRLLGASTRRLPVWIDCYGTTETQVLTVAAFTRGSIDRRLDSRGIGWTVPGARVRIADPQTGRRRLRQSRPGMIQAKSRARALSFVGTPTKFSQRRHGPWFDTGDWGRRGRWHQLEVLDRIADRIDGVHSCLQIEDRLLDRISDAAEVVVVPDGSGRPVPVICMREGTSLDGDTWRAAAKDIAGLADPVHITPADLPRTATVKARRYLLSELIKAGGADRGAPVTPELALREGA